MPLRASLLAEAERCYRESLRLSEAGNDLAGVATTANSLGVVCQRAGRPAEAETWYRRALDAFQALGDRRYEAVCANNLADLLLDAAARPPADRPAPFADRDLLAEAEAYARRAAKIVEALGPSEEPWKTYSILARIAEQQGRPKEARRWRRREQESFAAFAGAGAYIQQFQPLILGVVAACQGNEDARKQLEDTLPQMEARGGEWRQLSAAFRRILEGERDGDALTDGLPYASALIVRRILAALAGGAPG